MSLQIVLATWGSFGDLHPYMAIGTELRRRGHSPVIASIPLYRAKVEAAGLAFHGLRPDFPPPDQVGNLVRKIIDKKKGAEFIFRELLGPHFRDTYEDTLDASSGADLIVSHPLALAVPLVAEKTGIRWVSTVLSPISFFSAYDPPTPPSFSWGRSIVSRHRQLARAFTALGKRVSRRWVASVDDFRRELGLPAGPHPLFEGQHSPRRVLALFSPVFGPPQPDFPSNTMVTGFPFYDAEEEGIDPEIERFLADGPPPLLFTLGSSAVWAAGDFYETAAEAARQLGQRAILLTGSPDRRSVPHLPEGMAAFDYAPFGAIMPRTSVIVHQGGVGTTAQALRSGRPALVMPFGHDTLDNARRVVELGAGLSLSRRRFRPDRVAAAVGRLDSLAFANRAAELGSRIRSEDGIGTACDAIEESATDRD